MIEIKVPELSESVSEATLLEWHKQEGDAVAAGDVLVEVETDKIALEIPAPAAGVVAKIVLAAGADVKTGDVIAHLDDAAGSARGQTPPDADEKAANDALAAVTESAVDEKVAPAREAQASPSAKKIASEKGVDLAKVVGSGKGGRITKEDVIAAAAGSARGVTQVGQEKPTKPAPAHEEVMQGSTGPAASSPPMAERRVPMSKLRLTVAQRLLSSQRETATLTTFNEVNMRAIMDIRAECREVFEAKHGVKLGFMSFFVKAAVAALREFPAVNASIDGRDIVYHDYYDIGVAVGSKRGLVVPVVRGADRLSMAAIEKTIFDFGARAQSGALALDELSGGTFSITNGGVFGSMLSTPIINPPQSAILGVHATKQRAVVEADGSIVARPMCYFALSYDHRIIDGREAVLFLVAIKNALETPVKILLDI